jgi:hypothetical protein
MTGATGAILWAVCLNVLWVTAVHGSPLLAQEGPKLRPDRPRISRGTQPGSPASIEEQAAALKQKVLGAQLQHGLGELVLGGDGEKTSRALLFHRNEMGPLFVLERALYVLDGAPVLELSGPTLDRRAELEIFFGLVKPGPHMLEVTLHYRGHGYGLFSYLEGYQFKVQAKQPFETAAGKITSVRVIGFEKDRPPSDLKGRPAVRYDVEVAKEASALVRGSR